MLLALRAAVHTQRVFLINWQYPCALREHMQPSVVDWDPSGIVSQADMEGPDARLLQLTTAALRSAADEGDASAGAAAW